MKQTVSKERKQWKQRNQRHTEKVITNKKKKRPTKKEIHKQTKGETQTKKYKRNSGRRNPEGRNSWQTIVMFCFFNKLGFP